MEPKRTVRKAGESNKNARLKVALVSMIVLVGAVSAGSAFGNRNGTDNGSNSQNAPGNANGHDSGSGSGISPDATGIASMATLYDQQGNKSAAFEIKDFSFGVENPTTIGNATGGAGAGKIRFNEFTIKKTTDKASPLLFRNCAAGAHYKTVVLEMRKAGGDPNSAGTPSLRFTFGTVFTTKIDWSGPGDEGPEESITFVYGQLEVAYIAQDAGNSTVAGWDQVTNSQWDQAGGTVG